MSGDGDGAHAVFVHSFLDRTNQPCATVELPDLAGDPKGSGQREDPPRRPTRAQYEHLADERGFWLLDYDAPLAAHGPDGYLI